LKRTPTIALLVPARETSLQRNNTQGGPAIHRRVLNTTSPIGRQVCLNASRPRKETLRRGKAPNHSEAEAPISNIARQKRLSQTPYPRPRPRPQVNLSTHSSHQSFFLPKLVAALSLTPNAARQCLGCLDFGAARMELLDSRLLLLCCLVVPIVYHVYNRRKERQVIAQYIPFSISKTC